MPKVVSNGELASYLSGRFDGLQQLVQDHGKQLSCIMQKLDRKVDEPECVREREKLEAKLEQISVRGWETKLQVASRISLISACAMVMAVVVKLAFF